MSPTLQILQYLQHEKGDTMSDFVTEVKCHFDDGFWNLSGSSFNEGEKNCFGLKVFLFAIYPLYDSIDYSNFWKVGNLMEIVQILVNNEIVTKGL